MITQVFITLPVTDVPRSVAFHGALGYAQNPQFTGDSAACIIISEHIHLMPGTRAMLCEFSHKDFCDTSKALEVLHSLTCASRAQADDPVRKVIAAGGSAIEEAQDYAFMYHYGFVDPDGHCRGLNYMRSMSSV